MNTLIVSRRVRCVCVSGIVLGVQCARFFVMAFVDHRRYVCVCLVVVRV